jgi:hypothetical protein
MKRKLLSILLCLAVILSITGAAFATGGSSQSSSLDGVYEGYYYAAQGQTGLTLTITGDTATFEFYNLPGKSNAKSGSYSMSVTEKDGTYTLKGTKWIEQPGSYGFVGLVGTLSGNVFSGTVTGAGSGCTFYVERPNDDYQDLQDSIFGDHRYQVIDTLMTWEQAQEYCTQQGGYLATITSAEEAEFISGLLGGDNSAHWLGGLNSSGGTWHWDNGEDWTYGAAPAGSGYLKTTGGSWSAGTSTERAAFICEWGTWSNASNWAGSEMEAATQAGLIPDVLVGKDLTEEITRGEFAAVVVKLYEAMTGGKAIIAADCPLTDISTDASRLYILKAYNLQLVNGVGNNKFAPSDSLTREQMAAMLCRVYKLYQNPNWTLTNDSSYPLDISGVATFSDDADISAYARESVYFMAKSGIIQGVGDNKFAPNNTTTQQEAVGYANATREQAIAMALRTLNTLGG